MAKPPKSGRFDVGVDLLITRLFLCAAMLSRGCRKSACCTTSAFRPETCRRKASHTVGRHAAFLEAEQSTPRSKWPPKGRQPLQGHRSAQFAVCSRLRSASAVLLPKALSLPARTAGSAPPSMVVSRQRVHQKPKKLPRAVPERSPETPALGCPKRRSPEPWWPVQRDKASFRYPVRRSTSRCPHRACAG